MAGKWEGMSLRVFLPFRGRSHGAAPVVGACTKVAENPQNRLKHRKTKHTHHPVDDAMGNAEALLYLKSQGFQIELT